MHGYPVKLPIIMVFCLGVMVWTGCRGPGLGRKLSFWPFRRQTTDTVPGVASPADRIATLRKMGEKAAWAKPAEQERISSELAAAFQGETDPLVRIEIVRALSGYRTSAAASVLSAAAGDSDADVRVAACQALGKQGGPEAAAKLSEVLGSDLDMDVRLTAAKALGDTGDAGAVAALGEALEDRDPAMQYLAVQSLRKVTGQDLGNDVGRWRQYVKGELPARPEPISLAERIRRLF